MTDRRPSQLPATARPAPGARRGPRRRRLTGLALALACAVLALVAVAQDDRWRSVNDRGNRYEGLVEIPVSRPELEVVSLTGHRERFRSGVDLAVKFFLAEPSAVALRSHELQVDKQYLMEAKAGDWLPGAWNTFDDWSTGEVLDREGVPDTNLGLLITLGDGPGAGKYLPAFVYHSRPPARAERYVAHLRPSVRLRKLSYRLSRSDRPDVELDAGRVLETMEAGGAVRIVLDAADAAEGWLKVDVTGSYSSRPGGPTLSFELYHRPEIGG